MKNLFESGRAAELTERIERLRADSPRQWGTMTAPQALAHCDAPERNSGNLSTKYRVVWVRPSRER